MAIARTRPRVMLGINSSPDRFRRGDVRGSGLLRAPRARAARSTNGPSGPSLYADTEQRPSPRRLAPTEL